MREREKNGKFCFYRIFKQRRLGRVYVNAVADPGPLMLGVLDSWTPTVNVLQTLIAQISFHIELCLIEARDSISLYATPLSIWPSGFRDFFHLFCLK